MLTCKECGAEIKWIEMAKSGKKIPVEPKVKAFIIKPKNQGGKGQLLYGYVRHWQNCPAAVWFREKKEE